MNELNVVVVPGLGGSSPGHWQTLWQSEHPEWTRFQPSSWNQPELVDWASALDRAVDESKSGAILLAHSLGCLLALDFANRHPDKTNGLFLVAPPDPEAATFPSEVKKFAAATANLGPVQVPAVALTSTTDPYCAAERVPQLCRRWGVSSVVVGDAGHINVSSGHGPWADGYRAFADFLRPLHTRPKMNRNR